VKPRGIAAANPAAQTNSMNTKHNSARMLLRLTAGWSAVLLYVAAACPLGLSLATLLGSLDPSHQVLVAAGEHGGRLVFHHGSAGDVHQHSAMARTLTFFAQAAGAGDPDHVLQFASADSVTSKDDSTRLRHSASLAAIHAGSAAAQFSPLPLPLPRHRLRPSMDKGGALRCSRTTVLLI
jgi:hypothetical protein